MECPKCRTDNLPSSKFCRECATPLPASEEPEIPVTRTLQTGVEELGRGTTFAGRYEIIEELGAGGMGSVYRAFDKQLQEDVALKLIRPDIRVDRRTSERFRNEIKIARKITHKNVCRMYDFHEEGKTLYLTMEYVQGEDLKSLIHRTKVLSIGTAVSISRQVAEGLGEAHRLGIVHRDLKPGNIMIDRDGQAKIMDFGIARSLLVKGLTSEGSVVGTPEYMSPEQVEGKEADARSDIYALGIILYEMLIGRPPFEGEAPFSIANKHKTEPPPVPKKYIPNIPQGLNELILRCLEKDRAKRYQTAEELVADLSAVEKALPLTGRALNRAKTKTQTPREITVKLRPQKLILPAAIIVVLAMAIVIALTLFKPGRGKIDSLAVLPLDDLSIKKGEGFSVEGIHDALINELTKIPSINVIARQSVMRYKDSPKSIPEIGRELKVAGVMAGSVIQAKDTVRITVSLFNGRDGHRLWGPNSFDRNTADILSLYSEVALKIAREINAKLTAQNIEKLSRKIHVKPEAYKLFLQAASEELRNELPWQTWLQKRFDLLQQSVEIDQNFALGYAVMAFALHDLAMLGHNQPMAQHYEKARQSAQKALSLDESLSEAHEALGLIRFDYDWDFEGAEREYRRALELSPGRSSGPLISYLTKIGRFEEALALQKRAAESNPLYSKPPVSILFDAGRFEEAIAEANKYLEINPKDWDVRESRSNCYALRKRCAEALAETQKILSEKPDPDFLVAAVNYAYCGDRKKTEQLIEAVKKYWPGDPGLLAWIYAPLGETELALDALEKAFEQHSAESMSWLKVKPMYDPLRDEPRFKALLKKVGFEK